MWPGREAASIYFGHMFSPGIFPPLSSVVEITQQPPGFPADNSSKESQTSNKLQRKEQYKVDWDKVTKQAHVDRIIITFYNFNIKETSAPTMNWPLVQGVHCPPPMTAEISSSRPLWPLWPCAWEQVIMILDGDLSFRHIWIHCTIECMCIETNLYTKMIKILFLWVQKPWWWQEPLVLHTEWQRHLLGVLRHPILSNASEWVWFLKQTQWIEICWLIKS